MKKKHLQQLVASQYHKKGCIVRHAHAQQDSCKYAKNGYKVTISASRKKFYNAPRYDAAKILDLQQETVTRKPHGQLLTYRVPIHPKAGQKDVWDVDKHDNFVPLYEGGSGGHYPYKHNWHHMIPNEMLFQELYHKKHEYKLLELLMHGEYNLNGERNIVLLPKQPAVGEIINWPCHPNNHPRYDEFAQKKLSWLKEKLSKLLGNNNVCDVDKDKAKAKAEDVNKVSDNLFMILEQLPGGVHINSIKQSGDAIEASLRKKRIIT